jgi:lipopolysaccharide export system protein LptA
VIEYFLMAFFAAGANAPPGQGSTPLPPPAPTVAPVAPKDLKDPIHISADTFEIQGKRQQAVWSGRVRAVRGQTVITCDRLVAHYTRAQQISRLECVGNVEAVDGDRWAKGERAEFDNAAGVLVVTGSPIARQGPNLMRGTKVTFHVGKDLVQVENATIVWESAPVAPPRPKGKSK